MEPEKVAKFYEILIKYKGAISRRTFQNEEYREKRIYDFGMELEEKLQMAHMMMQKFCYSFFNPMRTIQVTFDRVVSNLAFCPPRDTYVFNFERNDQNDVIGEIMMSHFVTRTNKKLIDIYQNKFIKISKYLECFYTFSEYGNRIACIFIKAKLNKDSRRTIVYSHTNAEDIGTILSHLWKMKRKIGCNVFAYDYSGFGMSSGSPSERNLYADSWAAVQELMLRKNLQANDLVLMGESIGSAPTIYLATKLEAYGVVLQSSFLSGIRVYSQYSGPTRYFDPFPNIDRLPLIKSTTLVIHGTEDMLVDITHAFRIYQTLKNKVKPFWANGASHMNIHKHPIYYERIHYFIEIELDQSSSGNKEDA